MPEEDLSKLKIEKSAIAISARRKRRKWIYIGIAAIIAILVILFLTGVLAGAKPVQVVTASLMYPSQAFTELDASGYVVAERKAALAAKVTGRLVALYVEEGDKLKKGQIVAKLENEDVKAARAQAAANLSVARHNLQEAGAELQDAMLVYNRDKELMQKGYLSKGEFDAAEARYRKALASVSAAKSAVRASGAALQEANISVAYTYIRAPFDAVVLTKNADIGDIVTPIGAAANAKAAVVTIADMSSLDVEVDVSESSIEKVHAGQPCEIQLDAIPDTRFPGGVHMIVPTADRSKATVMVKVRFQHIDPRILPEMSARVAFLSRPVRAGEERPRVVINPSSVLKRKGEEIVFVIGRNSRAQTRAVGLGGRIGNSIEVLSGVEAGDKVALNPEGLHDGQKVRIVEK